MEQPNTALHKSHHYYDWTLWVGWRLKQQEWTDVHHALRVIMKETRGRLNPKMVTGYACPTCDATKIVDAQACINCDGKGWFSEYMNMPLVKPEPSKLDNV